MPTTMTKPTNRLPRNLILCEPDAPIIELRAAEGETKLSRFRMLAHTGQPIRYFGLTLIFDLKGMRLTPGRRLSILKNHDFDQVVGFADKSQFTGKGLELQGVLSASTASAEEVRSLSAEGFDWQASIGASVEKIQRLSAEDEDVTVNGHKVQGPAWIITQSKVYESSFVAAGADDRTSGVALAGNTEFIELEEDSSMPEKTGESKDTVFTLSQADLDARVAEAAKKATEENTQRLSALKEAFPDRPKFVLEQHSKGNSVQAAKAELSDKLLEENKDLKEENAKLKAENEQLSGGPDPVRHSGTAGGDGDGLPLDARCEAEWKKDAKLHKEFGDLETYQAFVRANDNGQVQLLNRN